MNDWPLTSIKDCFGELTGLRMQGHGTVISWMKLSKIPHTTSATYRFRLTSSWMLPANIGLWRIISIGY